LQSHQSLYVRQRNNVHSRAQKLPNFDPEATELNDGFVKAIRVSFVRLVPKRQKLWMLVSVQLPFDAKLPLQLLVLVSDPAVIAVRVMTRSTVYD
jgi:hypothetical protein